MFHNVSLYNKNIKIKAYTTGIEKDLLIMSSFENYNIDFVLEVLGLDYETIEQLSENEKKVVLYKYREISVGDELNIKFKCIECNQQNESSIEIGNFLIPPERNDEDILKIDKVITDDNLSDFLLNKIDVDELDIDEFEELKERARKNQKEFNFIKKCSCIKCKKENNFDVGDIKYIIESLSEDTLISMYRTYNDMTFFGKYTKQDVDSLYPFERTILIGLLNKTREDIKQ